MRPKLLILPSSLGCCILFLALSRARGQGLPDPHVNHTDPIPGHAICENTCLGEAADGDNDSNNTVWLSDGICDDGGPGAYYTGCDWGTDCDDCDPRDGGFIHPPSAQPIAPRELPQPSCRLRRLLCRGAQLRGRVRRGQYNLSGHHHARQQLWHAWALDPRGGRVDDPVSCPRKAGERHLTSQRVQPARQRGDAVGGAGAEPLQRVARRGHGGAARPRHRRHCLCRCAMEASAPSPPSFAPPTSNYTSSAPLPVAPCTFRRSSPRVARMHPHLCKPRGPAQSTMPSLRPPRHHRRLCCLRASLSSVSSATKTRTTGRSTR